MKIRDGYMLREVAGTAVVVPVGADNSFGGMLKLNGTGKFLWEHLMEETDKEKLLSALLAEYEITADVAAKDIDAFLAALAKLNILE